MTQEIVGYENGVCYSKISDQIYGENLLSLKALIEEEIDFIGNFHQEETVLDANIQNYDSLDQMIDNILILDNHNNIFKNSKKYDFAKNFIDQYSNK